VSEWKMVPVEPTVAMTEAAVRSLHGDAVYKNVSRQGTDSYESEVRGAYRAMLAAVQEVSK